MTTTTPGFEQMFAGSEKLLSMFGDLAGQGKANLEALTASAQVAAKGNADALALMAGSARASFERGFDLARSLAGATSVQQLVELQADFARTGVETALKDVGDLTGIVTTTTKETLRPITDRVSAVMAGTAAAAAL